MNRKIEQGAACILLASAVLLAPVGAQAVSLFGPGGKEFDVDDDDGGEIMDGTSDAYDSAFYLTVDAVRYDVAGVAGTSVYGGQGILMEPQTVGDLAVQREAWVPDTGSYDYLRYFDTIENTSSSTASVAVSYTGNLGSDGSTHLTADSSGDSAVTVEDRWYCTDDTYSDPALGFVWYGEASSVTPIGELLAGDDFGTSFNVDIPPGARVAFVIFAVQADDETGSREAAEWLAEFPEEAQEHLDGDDLGDIVNWGVAGAPLIRFTEEEYVVGEGGELEIVVEVEDPEGDPFTISWDLDGDETYDDGEGTSAVFSAVGLDGPSTREIGVRATDGENERIRRLPLVIENVPPEFMSDPETQETAGLELHRGQSWEYSIIMQDQANTDMPEDAPLDPLTVSILEKPAGMIYTAEMVLSWDVPRGEDYVGEHPVAIQCSDGDGGQTAQEFVLNVLENTKPTRPVIVSPREETVSTQRPTLEIENAEDLDGDDLSYVFQVATVGTFIADAIVDSATVVENMTGRTAWTVNRDLDDGERYYWRVWARDDKEEGPAASTFFEVDLSAAPEDVSEAADAPQDVVAEYPYEENGGGCGCSLVGAGTGRGFPGLTSVLMILAGMLRAPRRRGNKVKRGG